MRQQSRHARAPPRSTGTRCGARLREHSTQRRRDALRARAFRRAIARGDPRTRGPGACAGRRARHPDGCRGGVRRLAGRCGTRALRPGGGRRAGLARAQLHLRHDRTAQGRHVPPPGRLSPGRRNGLPRTARSGCLLPVDAADVPLQRLVLHLGGHRRRRHAPVPTRRRRERDLATPPRGGRHTLQRGSDRVGDDRRRPDGDRARPPRPRRRRWRSAVPRADRPARSARPGRHAPLRTHRDLRADSDQRVVARMGRADDRRAEPAPRPPGCRQHRRPAAARCRPRRPRRTRGWGDHRGARRAGQRRHARLQP